jgi:hypothetical protein
VNQRGACPVDKRIAIREAFREYIESSRRHLTVAEQCSIKGWPDRKTELRNCFRLQELFCQREELRFEHVISGDWVADAVYASLSSITKRLRDDWSAADELGLTSTNSLYKSIAAEIEACQASHSPDLVDGPLRSMQEDPELHTTRAAMREKILELNDRLAGMARG